MYLEIIFWLIYYIKSIFNREYMVYRVKKENEENLVCQVIQYVYYH